MRAATIGLVAAAAMLAGTAGCSLPEVLPLTTAATTPGPSPYGPWYEQHWATNSVLLAATDEPEGDHSADVKAFEEDSPAVDEPALDEPAALDEPKAAPHVVEVKAGNGEPTDFDTSTPYQFPSSQFAPKPAPAAQAPADSPPPASAVHELPAPVDGPIRY